MSGISAADRDRIETLFERHLEVGLHHGAQLAVYLDGKCVIDLAGGTPRPGSDVDETARTRHVIFSCTKPYSAVALHQLVEDGELDYDDRVVDHWPTFAEDGSEKAAITVRQVLSHTAGLPYGEFDARPDRWPDWDEVVRAMEEMEPVFPPGEQPAYHALTFGWLVGELVRRITGRSIRDVATERVFEPLGMDDTGIGLAEDEDDDVATLVAFDDFDRCRDPTEGLGGGNEAAAENFNSEPIRRAIIPAGNGIGTARDMARFYACLANGGELDGTRILEESTVDEMTRLHASAESDGTLQRPSQYGLGVWKPGPSGGSFGTVVPDRVFGHGGMGSSQGWADPGLGLAFSYVTNGMRDGSYEHPTRVSSMADAVRLAVAGER